MGEGRVIPFPGRTARVEALCRASSVGKAERPLVDAEEVDGMVAVSLGGITCQLDPEAALEAASRIATTAGDAISKRRSRG